MISDRDLLKALSPDIDTVRETTKDLATLNRKVHQIMTRKLVTLSERDTVKTAVLLFNQHRLSCLPVVDAASMPIGILTWRDIFKAIEDRYRS